MSLSAADIARLAEIMRLELLAENILSCVIGVETYNKIRWLIHCGKVYNLPARKLRKCHMRKYYQRRRQARERYL